MAGTVDEISINYSEDGVQLVKELDKVVLTKGAWATMMFKYQDWDKAKQEFGPTKYTIRRYQKKDGDYRPKSKFNISSADQAQKVIEALQAWLAEDTK